MAETQREKNLAAMRRRDECRRAWDVAIAAAHLMRQGITPPKHMMVFWERDDAK